MTAAGQRFMALLLAAAVAVHPSAVVDVEVHSLTPAARASGNGPPPELYPSGTHDRSPIPDIVVMVKVHVEGTECFYWRCVWLFDLLL